MVNSDCLLQGLTFVLIAANVWVLLTRDEHDLPCIDTANKSQDVAVRSQCDMSFLPDKCASLLNGVDVTKGLILGKQRDKKVFLTVGFAVWDDNVDNIRPVLSSFISHVTQEDASDVIIVISVSQEYISTVQRLINGEFRSQVESGLIHLVSPTVEYVEVLARHPPLGEVYFKDYSKEYISKITKFNKNMGFLLFYSHLISDFVFHISDQTVTNGRFVPEIKKQVENTRSTYFALLFSDLHLYPSSVLRRFTEFYAMFGLNSSPAIIYDYRYARQSRSELIDTNTKLFSIKKNNVGNKRPNARLETSLRSTDQEHTLEKAYSNQVGFFWSTTPKKHDYIQVVFQETLNLSRVLVETGSVFLRDSPSKAVLMVCPEKQQDKSCDLDNCQVLTKFGDPIQNIKNLETIVVFPVKCLRMEFTSDIDTWVIVRDISVWTDRNK